MPPYVSPFYYVPCNCNQALNTPNCSCFQRWFDSSGHEAGSECDCYIGCYACYSTCYGFSEKRNQPSYRACNCNATCYMEELTCSCNALSNFPVQACTCDNRCYGYQTCDESMDGCVGYACTCDGFKDREPCAQCDFRQYDTNAPKFQCNCNETCYSYQLANGCKCDGAYEKPEERSLCGRNTIQSQCPVYNTNVDLNYISSRYY